MSQTTNYSWIVSIPAMTVPRKSFRSIYDQAEDVLLESLKKSGRVYHIRRYIILSSGNNGSVSQLNCIADNMVRCAHQLYMDICSSRESLQDIHIIAAQIGAPFALKFLLFFNRFQCDLHHHETRMFDQVWNQFPLTGDEPLNQSLFQSMTVFHPSLPKPGFFARLRHRQPDVHYFTKANPTPKIRVSYSFNINGLVMTDQPIIIQGPRTKLVTLPNDTTEIGDILKKEFGGLEAEEEIFPEEEPAKMREGS